MKPIGRTIVIGLLTAAPLVITFVIVRFLFQLLSSVGEPWIRGVARGLRATNPGVADLLLNDTLQSIAAVLVVLAFLYVLGWGTGRVIGQRLISLFEKAVGAIPFVETIYRATKRFLAISGPSGEGTQRVVLIDFPSRDMKAIGIVTRTLRDATTGEELAAVYVPTAPNPTNGYIEIVPIDKVTFTDWTFDQAMAFVVTGGSNAPDTVHYRQSAPGPAVASGDAPAGSA
ncbi:DUF502 domain-containing protein [Aquibium microcysteis]|uniref:DUF502 domain-containing protein n=1 Tax=Aquibium microcysteis TaxID=675281 RepID=UPI00165CFEDC|nr:DUF502 domain-containing protein [Aquibium microcysteis]